VDEHHIRTLAIGAGIIQASSFVSESTLDEISMIEALSEESRTLVTEDFNKTTPLQESEVSSDELMVDLKAPFQRSVSLDLGRMPWKLSQSCEGFPRPLTVNCNLVDASLCLVRCEGQEWLASWVRCLKRHGVLPTVAILAIRLQSYLFWIYSPSKFGFFMAYQHYGATESSLYARMIC
jgi:hypothetical protein